MIWLITRRSYLLLLKLIWRSGEWIGQSYAQFERQAHYYCARIIAHTDSSGATRRSTRDEEVFLYDFGLPSAEGTENTETQNRRKQTGGDIIIHLSSADDPGPLARRITHTIANTIAHPGMVWWRKEHHFHFLIRLFLQFEEIRRPILTLNNRRGMCLALLLRCFQRWASSGVDTFLGVERPSFAVNFVGSCTGFSLFKSITAK